jgi:type VI secretion system protein ImpF
MTELPPRERLQPSLLDRLTDEAPAARQETREQRVISLRRLRESVVRDLEWLLNTTAFDTVVDLEGHPEAANSVLNYGVPDLSGRALGGLDVERLERSLRDAICRFEPRLLRNTVRVRANVDAGETSRNALRLDIEAELWAEPVPLHLWLKTELDLESGQASVEETGKEQAS